MVQYHLPETRCIAESPHNSTPVSSFGSLQHLTTHSQVCILQGAVQTNLPTPRRVILTLDWVTLDVFRCVCWKLNHLVDNALNEEGLDDLLVGEAKLNGVTVVGKLWHVERREMIILLIEKFTLG